MRDKIAVVTGGGQGMGRAISQRLATANYHVYLIGRTLDKLQSVAAEIGPGATAYQLDVTDSAQVNTFAASLNGATVDVLVNCAGEAFLATIDQTTDADWARILSINLTGPFLMIRALLPLLRQSDNASIINLASKVALKGYHPVSAYTAAKTGLVGMTRALAAELEPEEIRAVALCPGPVDTPMRWAATPDFDRRVVIDTQVISDLVWYIINLPRGTTASEILVQSEHYD